MNYINLFPALMRKENVGGASTLLLTVFGSKNKWLQRNAKGIIKKLWRNKIYAKMPGKGNVKIC